MVLKSNLPNNESIDNPEMNQINNERRQALDRAIQRLQEHKKEWAETPATEYIKLLDNLLQNLADCANEWARLDHENRGLNDKHWDSTTSLVTGPIIGLRCARNYKKSLEDIVKHGKPRFPGPVKTVGNDQLSVGVFPNDLYDKILFKDFTSEIYLEPGVKKDEIPAIQAVRYNGKPFEPKVSLVLSAGNVAALTISDTLFQLFTQRHVVLIKAHPVLKYVEPIYKKIFQHFIERGFVEIVTGDIPETQYIVNHTGVDDVHITGSDKTFEALVYGPGEQGKKNKLAQQPLLKKKMTGELGNVSPLIVIPGPWSEADMTYQAKNIVSSIVLYGGFFCLTTRVIIQHTEWNLRKTLLDKIRDSLNATPPTAAHYPGAKQRIQAVIEQHPEAETYGKTDDNQTPWTFVANLANDKADEPCFNSECFASFSTETSISASSIPEYIDKAVEFCNKKLWGTLSAMIIIHPDSLKDEKVREAFERAKLNLHYGTICINHPTSTSYILATNAWGGYPGQPDHDIQSGNVHVNNTFMFERTQKTITTGPFKMNPPPSWFPDNPKARNVTERLLEFEKKNSVWNLLKVLSAAMF